MPHSASRDAATSRACTAASSGEYAVDKTTASNEPVVTDVAGAEAELDLETCDHGIDEAFLDPDSRKSAYSGRTSDGSTRDTRNDASCSSGVTHMDAVADTVSDDSAVKILRELQQLVNGSSSGGDKKELCDIVDEMQSKFDDNDYVVLRSMAASLEERCNFAASQRLHDVTVHLRGACAQDQQISEKDVGKALKQVQHAARDLIKKEARRRYRKAKFGDIVPATVELSYHQRQTLNEAKDALRMNCDDVWNSRAWNVHDSVSKKGASELLRSLMQEADGLKKTASSATAEIQSMSGYVQLLRRACADASGRCVSATSLEQSGFQLLLDLMAGTVHECGICCCPVEEPTFTRCVHLFCAECVTSWIKAAPVVNPDQGQWARSHELCADKTAVEG